MWSNRWSTMPIPGAPHMRLPLPDERAVLDRMPGSTVPVIHQVWTPGDTVPYWAALGEFSGNHLYALSEDPAEDHNLAGGTEERDAEDQLRAALEEVEAPPEQLARLGLA
jgi:hypothetical protein